MDDKKLNILFPFRCNSVHFMNLAPTQAREIQL